MRAHRRPLLGLIYLVVLALLVAVCVATYNKQMPWQASADVTLRTRTPGLELNPLSDVKFQGVRVGEVKDVTTDGREATIELAIDPDRLDLIPADVDAAIIPKTLFGEKYVDLRAPVEASPTRLAAGDEISQSTTSVELGLIFDRLVPILQTLRPDQLSTLLGSLAEAVDGRGEDIAAVLRNGEDFLQALRPSLPTLVEDLRLLSDTADIYAEAAPDVIDLLESASGVSTTFVESEAQLQRFLDAVIATADRTTAVLDRNGAALVRLNGRARPVLKVLRTYATVVPCVLRALYEGNNLANHATGARGAMIGLTVDLVVANDPYRFPEDDPKAGTNDAALDRLPEQVPNWRPHCPQLPARAIGLPDVKPYTLQPYAQVDPPQPGDSSADGTGFSRSSQGAPTTRDALGMSVAAAESGRSVEDVPDYAALMMAPLLATGEVTLR